jgi:hypothetical protein
LFVGTSFAAPQRTLASQHSILLFASFDFWTGFERMASESDDDRETDYPYQEPRVDPVLYQAKVPPLGKLAKKKGTPPYRALPCQVDPSRPLT